MESQVFNRTRPIDLAIAERLKDDEAFRGKFIRRWAQAEVANALRSMRQRRRLNQKQLAAKSGTGQSAISRSEQADYDGWTFKTLVRLAEALRARLRVALEPIEDVIQIHSSSEFDYEQSVTGGIQGPLSFSGDAIVASGSVTGNVPHELLFGSHTPAEAVAATRAVGSY